MSLPRFMVRTRITLTLTCGLFVFAGSGQGCTNFNLLWVSVPLQIIMTNTGIILSSEFYHYDKASNLTQNLIDELHVLGKEIQLSPNPPMQASTQHTLNLLHNASSSCKHEKRQIDAFSSHLKLHFYMLSLIVNIAEVSPFIIQHVGATVIDNASGPNTSFILCFVMHIPFIVSIFSVRSETPHISLAFLYPVLDEIERAGWNITMMENLPGMYKRVHSFQLFAKQNKLWNRSLFMTFSTLGTGFQLFSNLYAIWNER